LLQRTLTSMPECLVYVCVFVLRVRACVPVFLFAVLLVRVCMRGCGSCVLRS
jgi:hypothetical protein